MPETLQLDDLTALRQYARTRDPRAFEILIQRYQALVYRTCQRQLRNASDAEDATQETFVKLARKAGQVRSGLAGWLHACAVGTSRDLIRRNATRRGHERAYGEDAAVATDPSKGEFTWAELGPEVDAAMDALSADDRSLIAARFLTGTPQTELAAAAGVSPSAIHQRIDRAVGRLRKTLSKRGVALNGSALAVVLAEAGAEAATVPAALTGALVKVGLAGVGGGQAGGAVGGGGVVAKLVTTFQGLGLAGKAAVIATAMVGGTGVGAAVMHANGPADPSGLSASGPVWVESPPLDRSGETSEAWLDGTWRVVEAYTHDLPVEWLTFEGDTLRCAVTIPGQPGEAFDLVMRVVDNDPQAQPAVLVLDVLSCTYPEPNAWHALVGQRIEAIYTIENGALTAATFADGQGRPTDFDSPDGRPLLGWYGFIEPGPDPSAHVVGEGIDPRLGARWRYLPYRHLTIDQGQGTVWVPFGRGGIHEQFEVLSFTPQAHPDGRVRVEALVTAHVEREMVSQRLPILMRFDGPDTLWLTNFEGPEFFKGKFPQGFEIEDAPGQAVGRLIRIR
ncbi:MAG: sigma-70 family RNA polymerase sigma factor [Planctomycetota bacterium]